MPDKPPSFREVVAAQDPADRARLANGESFEDVTVSSPFHQQVTVIEDSDAAGDWRVEYFDDGWCRLHHDIRRSQGGETGPRLFRGAQVRAPASGPRIGRTMSERPPKPSDRPASPRYKQKKSTQAHASPKSLRSLGRELPGFPEDFAGLIYDWIHTSDRAAAMVASASLELCLEQMIVAQLPQASGIRDKLIERDGPLNGFFRKSYLGFAMGLYNGNVLAALEVIRNIRNAFAHTVKPLFFSTPLVSVECLKLKYKEFVRAEWPDNFSEERAIFTFSCAYLAQAFSVRSAVEDSKQKTATFLRSSDLEAFRAKYPGLFDEAVIENGPPPTSGCQ
jgi:hypothetical protein